MQKNTTFKIVFLGYILFFLNAFATNSKVSTQNFNNRAEEGDSLPNLLDILKDAKHKLEVEKSKTQLFEENFLLLNNILKNPNLSINEILKQYSEATGKLNNLLRDEEFISTIGQNLKGEVLQLEKLIELFIKIKDFDLSELVVNFNTISDAINSINNFLSEREKSDSFLDSKIPVRSFDNANIDIKIDELPKEEVDFDLDKAEEFILNKGSLVTKASDFIVYNKVSITKTASGLLKDMAKGGLVFSGIRRILKRI